MKLTNKIIKTSLLILTLIGTLYVQAANAANETDKQINSSIHQKIANNPKLSHYNIHVEIKNGEVTLSGVVGSDKEAGILITETQSVSGVKEINTSNLKLKNNQHPLKDTIITAKIKGKFIEKEIFSELNLEAMGTHVSTKNGIVTLSGKVKNQERANNAVAIAKSVKGVKEVHSNIKIMQ